MNKYLIATLCLYSAYGIASDIPLNSTPHNNTLHNLEQLQEQRQRLDSSTTLSANEPLHFSTQQLLENPQLLEKLLDEAIETRQISAIDVLLPIYQQSTQQDDILVDYAQAVLASAEQNPKKAIDLYRQIIAKRPELTPMRFNLAFLLLQDKQFEAAKHQLDKISREQDLPANISEQIWQAYAWIEQQNQWKIQARLRYVNDKNINQAPTKQTAGWTLPTPQTAQGLAYYLSLGKSTPLKDNWALHHQAIIDGKSYNKHRYDDIQSQFELGISHRNSQQEWLITPLYARRWFGTQGYSHSTGVRGQYARLFSPHWQGFASFEYTHKRHDQRQYLDGSTTSVSLSGAYSPTVSQSWLFGMDTQKAHTKDTSERYRRIGAWVGYEKEWRQGISTAGYAGIGTRHYRHPDVFQITRQDTEYFTQLSLWHRAKHWRGLTPKIVWTWQRTDSNHFMYGHDKHNIFVEVSKTF